METGGYDVNHLVEQARSRWLIPAEVLFIIQNHHTNMRLQSVPQQPSSGSLFLYDRNNLPSSFRKDGHNWRKKPHKEGHERLKVQTVAVLNCYYATGEYDQFFKRRCYWMLDEANKHIVLAHYRDTTGDNTNSALNLAFSPGQSSTFTQCENQPTASLSGIHGSSQSLNSLHSVQHKFQIRAISPQWCFANEVTKVIIIGSFRCDPSEIAWAMFGDRAVPIQIIQDGVICCEAPPMCPGKVTLCIAFSNGESCSEVNDFEYRDRISPCNNCITGQQEKSRNMEEGQLLVKFAQMLLSDYTAEPQLVDYNSSSDWVLRELLKDKLQQWLSARIPDGYGNLSQKEQGIIHIVAGLGYEWALEPILASGVGVNFRDAHGWTALHWASRFGREKIVVLLLANGASVSAITHPTAQDPIGGTPACIANAYGHKGLAGYLSELALTTHFSSLTLQKAHSVHMEAEADSSSSSMEFAAAAGEQSSMKEVLAACRNATHAAALIKEAFRVHSFRKRQQREAANFSKVDEYGLTPDEVMCISAAAALTIQKCYRGWKRRKYFLTKIPQVVKIQAHMRGYRVRKYYKVIWAVGILEKIILRWYQGRPGLRGFRSIDENVGEDQEDDIVRKFRRERVYTSFREAVKRVQSMIHCRQARDQYCRILEIFHQAKQTKLGASTNEEALTSLVDAFPVDDDSVFQLAPDSSDYSELWTLLEQN